MVPRSIFVGRGKELETLSSLLFQEKASLVTLWGPGGVGKTTIARQILDRARTRDRETVRWVDLAAARSARDVRAAFATALGIASEGEERDATDALVRAVSTYEGMLLLIADNAEQLTPEGRAIVVAIAEAPRVRMLMTSRDAFGIPNEHAISIEPLPDDDALALFASLSGAEVDDDARAIVRRLDALPLAIELAASRASLVGTRELLSRLDRKLDVLRDPSAGRPERHATLRAAIAWSFDLTDDRERKVLTRCAMFEGTFDAVLVEQSMGREESADVMDVLERLRQRALIHGSGARLYDRGEGEPSDEDKLPSLYLLESVRDFAREHRTPADEQGHAEAVLARAEPHAASVRRGGALTRAFTRRRADLIAAAARTIDLRTRQRAADAVSALLLVTGFPDLVLEIVLAVESQGGGDDVLRVRLAIARGAALRLMGRSADAELVAARAVVEAEALSGNDTLLAEALRLHGNVARSRGEAARAITLLERAHALFTTRDEKLAGIVLGEIGAAYQSLGQLARARKLHAEAIAIHVAEGSIRAEGVERSYLAVATHRGGDPAASIPLHQAALDLHRAAMHRRLEGAELLHLGYVHHQLGAPAPARDFFREAERVLAASGARGLEAFAMVLLASLETDEGNVEAARVLLARAKKLMPKGWPRLEATHHLIAGHLAFGVGDFAAASSSYEAARTASTDVEVGFEALTPAYLALARHRGMGAKPSDRQATLQPLLDEARAKTRSVENPHVEAARLILEAAIMSSEPPAPSPLAVRASSDVRRALAFVGARRGLAIREEARRLVLPDGREVDLSRRKNVRLILLALAKARRDRPGGALTPEALIEAGWPSEKMRAEAATKRLHTAIWTLRSLGLDEALLSTDEGYFLDPKIRLDLDGE